MKRIAAVLLLLCAAALLSGCGNKPPQVQATETLAPVKVEQPSKSTPIKSASDVLGIAIGAMFMAAVESSKKETIEVPEKEDRKYLDKYEKMTDEELKKSFKDFIHSNPKENSENKRKITAYSEVLEKRGMNSLALMFEDCKKEE